MYLYMMYLWCTWTCDVLVHHVPVMHLNLWCTCTSCTCDILEPVMYLYIMYLWCTCTSCTCDALEPVIYLYIMYLWCTWTCDVLVHHVPVMYLYIMYLWRTWTCDVLVHQVPVMHLHLWCAVELVILFGRAFQISVTLVKSCYSRRVEWYKGFITVMGVWEKCACSKVVWRCWKAAAGLIATILFKILLSSSIKVLSIFPSEKVHKLRNSR